MVGRAPGCLWNRGGFVATVAAVAAATLSGWFPSSSSAADQPSRFSLAGGCYSLAPASSGQPIAAASRLRLQATRLGSYLLFGTAQDFLAASGTGVARAVPASGCAVFPEAELNVSGTPAKGKPSYGEVRGLLDGHMHWMTFEYLGGNFHCGRPWHPYGIPAALPDCSEIEGPKGSSAPVQNFLNYGSPVAPHDTTGWPKLTEWGRENLTYEGTYYRWLERAWMAGLRLIAMPINENRELCQLIASR